MPPEQAVAFSRAHESAGILYRISIALVACVVRARQLGARPGASGGKGRRRALRVPRAPTTAWLEDMPQSYRGRDICSVGRRIAASMVARKGPGPDLAGAPRRRTGIGPNKRAVGLPK